MSTRLVAVTVVALAAVTAGCGGATAGGTTTTAPSATVSVAPTVPPGPSMSVTTSDSMTTDTMTTDAVETTTALGTPSTATSPTAPVEPVPAVGEVAAGNKILMIGDSILAATASRFGGSMCRALTPLGWQVLLEAEASRPISFAAEVQASVDTRLPDIRWDAGLIFLGTNFFGQPASYQRALDRAVRYFGDVPVVLVTLTEYDSRIPAANRAIEAVAAKYSNVSLIDWRTVTADRPQLLISDGVHPNDRGRAVLIQLITERLGQAPKRPGRCLASTFIDDAELPEGVMPTTTAATAPRSTTSTAPPTTNASPSSTPVTTEAPPETTAAPATASPVPTSAIESTLGG
ncbi:MAG: hypothetical protein RI958_1061 [Actinomycetota bacterium]